MDTSPNPKSPDPSVFLRPLCISLAIVVAIAVSLVSYHIILVRYCLRRRRRMADARSSPIFQRSERASIGVEEHVLHKLPIILYTNNCTNLADSDQNECVVCLGELEEGEKVRSLPNCGHLFHVPCIDDWLSAHTNCPICRTPIIIPTSSPIDFSNLEESTSEGREILAQNVGQREQEGNNSDGSVENRLQNENVSSNLVTEMVSRQSLSLVLPREKPQSLRVLKRSLSMDQCFVNIDIQGQENEDNVCANSAHHSSSASSSTSCCCCCSSSSSSSSNNYLKEFLTNYRTYFKGRTTRQQVDQVSSRLLRSFSQMRSMPNETALPC